MRKERKQDLAIATGVGSIPLTGFVGKGNRLKLLSGKKFTSKPDLLRNAKSGDIIFTSAPWGQSKSQSINKAFISAVMGNPSGYHPLLVEKVNKDGTANVLELSSDQGFKRSVYRGTNNPDNFTLLRSQKNVQPAVDRMARIVDANDRLDNLLKDRGLSSKQIAEVRRSAHPGGGKAALMTAGKELFVPQALKKNQGIGIQKFDQSVASFESDIVQHADEIANSIKRTGKIPKNNPLACLGGMCTSPLARSGMPITEKSSLKFVGPNDFLRSKNYKVVGYSPARRPSLGGRAANMLLRATPSALRVGAGLALGGLTLETLKKLRRR